jgi:hypothetical protein
MDLVITMLEEQVRISRNRLDKNHYPKALELTVMEKIKQCNDAIAILSASQKLSASDEALPIGDVVNCSSCKYQMSGTTEPCRSCILFSNHTPK